MEEDNGVKAPVTRLRRRPSEELSDPSDANSPLLSAPSTPTKKRGRLAAKPQLELIGENAPVTRLRRRPSVELSDPSDLNSPSVSAPSTPTKKRGRLAAKPQLELIGENDPQNSPKRAPRRSIARDIVEEEKPVTPSRRSTRIKSNTSIVSETQPLDSPRAKRAAVRRTSQAGSDNETPITPARTRRARKDSTSSVDKASPASDTVATTGRTRRTRKNSTSSIDKQAEIAPSALITEVISEEPENNLPKSTGSSEMPVVSGDQDTSPSLRKSPRLAKKDRLSISNKSDDNNENISQNSNETSNQTKSNEIPENNTSKENTVIQSGDTKDKLSVSSSNLINDLDTEPKMSKKSKINKSMSSLIDSDDSKKRHRTKSWSNVSVSQSNEGNFYSDNESTKKKLKKIGNLIKRLSDLSGSGDSLLNTSKDVEKSDAMQEKQETSEIIVKSSKKKKNRSESSFTAEIETSIKNSITPNKSENLNKSTTKAVDVSNESNKENLHCDNPKNDSVIDLLFAKTPGNIKSTVFIDDSDTDSVGKVNKHKHSDKEDQCVPVVDHKLETQDTHKKIDLSVSNLTVQNQVFNAFVEENIRNNDSCEPMDIDETLPENVSLTQFSKEHEQETEVKQSRKSSLSVSHVTEDEANENCSKSKRKSSISNSVSQSLNVSQGAEEKINESINKSKRKSSISNSTAPSLNMSNNFEEKINESANKSKSKSSISNSMSLDLEKTENENKSTLILSQIKDMSSTENNASKSLHNDILSKSIDIPDCAKDDTVKNKNISLNYLTSTPVHQKDIKKLGMQMNTSVISPNNDSKKELRYSKNISKKDVSILSNSSEESESSEYESDTDDDEEEESSKDKSNLMDDEAEDAGDDYASGDSQDEDARQYERENQILERGETLTSDDEISNDSDYEKDSFVVSSDEQDSYLLTSSGDDLHMSDNELTMSAKSKKKYNERKMKEQKKASKEMYEARHKLNLSEKITKEKSNKKSGRSRLDSSLLESEEDAKLPPKKKGRLRLDSSVAKSEEDYEINNKNASIVSDPEEIGYKKKKSKRLSESFCINNTMNENEITVCDTGKTDKDPLSVQVKQEPKTPQKSLDISTVHFTSREEIEEIQVDENASIMKSNESMDPLQATMAQDDGEDTDSESISENEEIAKNYDSMLNELNKDNESKPIKSCDISLNLNKKSKNKNEQIIEQLNLAHTKKPKNKNVDNTKEKSVKSAVQKTINGDEEEASSDSIDLKLLFSDDSNGSEKDSGNKKEETVKFIPLKRTEAKTNIREDFDETETSKKSRKSHKSSQFEGDTKIEDREEENANFFVDTAGSTGTNDLHTSMNTTLNTSSKKKKNKNNSISLPVDVQNNEEATVNFFTDTTGTRADLDSSKNVSLNTSSKIKKQKKNSISAEEPIQNDDENKGTSVNFFVDTTGVRLDSDIKNTSLNTSHRNKKYKKISITLADEPELVANDENSNDAPTETSYRSEKNKELTTKSDAIEHETEISGNTSVAKTLKSGKKKKKLSECRFEDVTDGPAQNVPSNSPKLKKKNAIVETDNSEKDEKLAKDNEESNSKKRKRKSSANKSIEVLPESSNKAQKALEVDESTLSEGKKKKLKITRNEKGDSIRNQDVLPSTQATSTQEIGGNKKKNKRSKAQEIKLATMSQPDAEKKAVNKKRKERDDDDVGKKTKVIKKNSSDKIHVPRLPSTVLHQLEDKPDREVLEARKTKTTSTTNFTVEETVRRKNKPSNYLEESIYLNHDNPVVGKKPKTSIRKPKVLPFIPTASTSDSGFTTKFQVNVLPQKIEFVAQKSDVPNFKNDYLKNNKAKRLRTYELYRNHRSVKLSKY